MSLGSPELVGARRDQQMDEISLGALVAPLIERWRTIAVGAIAGAVLGVALALLLPSKYTAETSFAPETSSASSLMGALGSLGALGGSLGGLGAALPSASSSPEFFASLLQSRELREATLKSRFRDPESGTERPLLDILDPPGNTPARRLGEGVRRLAKLTSVSVDKKTGIVGLTATMRDPALAAAVANRMTTLLNEFNLERRQSSSRSQREFAERRLRTAEAEMRGAEARQLDFLQSNRAITQSPALQATAARLDREVRLKQDVYLSLSKAFEEARIAEVRDTPLLTLIDGATPPDRRSSPRRVLTVVAATILGALVGIAMVVVASLRSAGSLTRRELA
jgi:uncharacterized protein involved in exopolysaccharide biosynthesis